MFVPQYDPYSFLDKMAMPFDTLPRLNNKKDLSKATPSEPVDGDDVKKPMPHCKACTDFKTWMELTAHPRRVGISLFCQLFGIFLL